MRPGRTIVLLCVLFVTVSEGRECTAPATSKAEAWGACVTLPGEEPHKFNHHTNAWQCDTTHASRDESHCHETLKDVGAYDMELQNEKVLGQAAAQCFVGPWDTKDMYMDENNFWGNPTWDGYNAPKIQIPAWCEIQLRQRDCTKGPGCSPSYGVESRFKGCMPGHHCNTNSAGHGSLVECQLHTIQFANHYEKWAARHTFSNIRKPFYEDSKNSRCWTGGGGKDVAQGKPTTQSSTAYGAESARGVDGNTNSQFAANSCTHTNREISPWWRVDLVKQANVQLVQVFNRGDCCGHRLNQFVVNVGNDGAWAKNPSCAGKHNVPQGGSLKVNCHGKTGRYVFIVLKGISEVLTLCEVKVFTSGEGGAAEQSLELGNRRNKRTLLSLQTDAFGPRQRSYMSSNTVRTNIPNECHIHLSKTDKAQQASCHAKQEVKVTLKCPSCTAEQRRKCSILLFDFSRHEETRALKEAAKRRSDLVRTKSCTKE